MWFIVIIEPLLDTQGASFRERGASEMSVYDQHVDSAPRDLRMRVSFVGDKPHSAALRLIYRQARTAAATPDHQRRSLKQTKRVRAGPSE
jgi:hypothetical protein